MATLWMHVFASAQDVAQGNVLQQDKATITGTSAPLAVLAAEPTTPRRRIRLFTDADCYVEKGDNPTADTNSMPMAANQTEYFELLAGQRVAVIERT